MTFEDLKKEFEQNGFKIDGDSFVHERTEYSTINVNRQVYKQPHATRFEMKYLGECTICNAGESDGSDIEVLYEFDVVGQGGEPAYSICVRDFEDFTKMI